MIADPSMDEGKADGSILELGHKRAVPGDMREGYL